MGWRQLQAILTEARREVEIERQRAQYLCPFDNEPLQIAADGTLFCEFDGIVRPFELESP